MNFYSSVRPSSRSAVHSADSAPLYLGYLALSSGESLSQRQLVNKTVEARQERLSNLGLSDRDLAIIHSVAACRLITAQQLQRLHFYNHQSIIGGSRACRRVLHRLTKDRLLYRRTRRIGGVRHGSSAFVYSLGSKGVKLLGANHIKAYTSDPSDYFFEHTVALAELYTHLHELNRSKSISMLDIQTEPSCWRQFPSGKKTLRPDMYVRFFRGDEEHSYFIELDRGTAHLPSLQRKLQLYLQYFESGIEQQNNGVFPQVLWVVPDNDRKAVLCHAIVSLQTAPSMLFAIETNGNLASYL